MEKKKKKPSASLSFYLFTIKYLRKCLLSQFSHLSLTPQTVSIWFLPYCFIKISLPNVFNESLMTINNLRGSFFSSYQYLIVLTTPSLLKYCLLLACNNFHFASLSAPSLSPFQCPSLNPTHYMLVYACLSFHSILSPQRI